jgi:cell wall-associated NlpC family hydrolase
VFRRFFPCSAAFLLCHCASGPDLTIPEPAPTVRRAEAIATAYAYSRLEWQPQEQHRKHGPDQDGVLVHTPDSTLPEHGFSNGWWQTGKVARGMAYQWGGFDTPKQFLASLDRGEAAGDISTQEKRRLGDAATSKEACGIDCSGFVSRCWRLSRPYSTKELPSICDRLESWDELKPGDILLNDRHVVLFAKWGSSSASIYAYEAGPLPVWRVNAAEIRQDYLIERGYQPWRYRGIRD